MKAFLSIFICLALLMSCFALAEPVEAAFSKEITIDNIKVRLGTDEYELPLSGKIGFVADEDGIFYDIGVDYNSSTLFPIQVKFSQDSLALLIGKSSTAYVFDSALFKDDDSIRQQWDDLVELLPALADYAKNPIAYTNDDATNAAVNEALDKAFSAPEEDATYADQPAKKRAGTVDSAALYALLDEVMNAYSPEYTKYVLEYLRFATTWGNIDSVDVDEDGNIVVEDDIPEEAFDSFSALLNALKIEITCDYDLVYTESGAGKEEYVFHLKSADFDEEFAIPMTVLLEDANHATIESVFSIEEDGEKVDFSLAGTVNAGDADFAFSAVDSDANTVSAAFDAAIQENGSISSNAAIDLSGMDEETPIELHLAFSSAMDASYNGTLDYAFSVMDDEIDFGLDFTATVQDAEIEDRIASAKEKRFSTDEDVENGASMLLMRVMSLAGDVETLMNDPTISDLSNAFNDLIYSDTPVYDYEAQTADDLPFKLPEFTALPEGFELVNESYYAYDRDNAPYGTAMLRYDLPSDDDDDFGLYYTFGVSVTIRGPIEASKEYSLDADGKLVAQATPTVESPKITVISDSDYMVEFNRDGISYDIEVYNNVIPLEDISAFLAGIVWAE